MNDKVITFFLYLFAYIFSAIYLPIFISGIVLRVAGSILIYPIYRRDKHIYLYGRKIHDLIHKYRL